MLRRVGRDECGTGMVELALFAPVLALFTVGIVDLGMGLTKRMELHQALNRTLEKVAAREFAVTDSEGKLDSTFIVNDIVAATGIPAEEVSAIAWLECDGEVQTPEAEMFNGTCPEPADADPSCATATPAVGAKCEAVLARYIEIDIEHAFRPLFGQALPGVEDGAINLYAQAAVRIQ
jgi:hypothetical protein